MPAISHRRIATLAAALAADFAILGLAQIGVIRRLPDPPLPHFDNAGVIRSRYAFPFGIPDSTLAVVGLGGILALASRRPRTRFWDRALVAATAVGAIGAGYYLSRMIKLRTFCAYCLANTAGMFALLPMAIAATRSRAPA
jgi:uncharacterized membrane protein